MKILVIAADYPPDLGGIQLMIDRLVRCWPMTDQLLVVSPHGLHRRPLATRQSRTRLPHHLAIVAANLRALWVSLFFRPDVVVSGHVVVAPAAMTIRRILHVPVVQMTYGRELSHRRMLVRRALVSADRVVAISRYTAALVTKLAPRARVAIVNPGVDARDLVAVRQDVNQVVTVARLDDLYKGIDVLIRAMSLVRKQHPEAHLVVVGGGRLRKHYEQIAEQEGLAGVVSFAGIVSDSTRDELLAGSAVFAMPSRTSSVAWGDGFGIVFLEAGMQQLPVVAGNAGATDAVIPDQTGLLVDPADATAVAEAVGRLLANPELRDRLGRAGRDMALQRSWDRTALSVAHVAETVLGAGARR